MKLLLIGLAVCFRVGTYAQWGPYRSDILYNINRPAWEPSWVDQDRYRSYVTPNWVNGWNSYMLNPFQFWYQPYSTLPYTRYIYQNGWNQQDPIKQYQDRWSSRNNYYLYDNQPWNRLSWSQGQEYRPFRNEAYEQGPIMQNYYPRRFQQSVQPSYWNLRNWNLNRQYHPINQYHPYQIRSYQPRSVRTYPSFQTRHNLYYPYSSRSYHSYPSQVFRRQSYRPNPMRRNRPYAYNPYVVQTERSSPISTPQPKPISHGSSRKWYINSHYNPRSISPSAHSYDSRPTWSHQPSYTHTDSHSHLIRPHRFYPLNYYLAQQASNHQHPNGIYYHNDNKNRFYHLYHSYPSQSNHAVNTRVVPVKKDPIDLSALWFLNKLFTSVPSKPINHSPSNTGFIPFDMVIVRKVISPVKPKLENRPRVSIHRPDVVQNTPSTIKPILNDINPVSTKPFRPLHEKVESEKPQHTVFVNWNQPSSYHSWYPQNNPWNPAKDIGTKPATATVA